METSAQTILSNQPNHTPRAFHAPKNQKVLRNQNGS